MPHPSLSLTDHDRMLLAGRQGEAMQFAMELIVQAARIDQADSLIDVTFAHIDACFYNGRAHLDFVRFLYYAPGMLPVEVIIGSLAECVESAVLGRVEIDRLELGAATG